MTKILVIDDEPSITKLVSAYLQPEGYEVHVAADGPSGLKAARAFKPDLVILDVMLPGMDGIELLSRLRRESDVYVILLTARTEETDKIVGLSVGADDYVTKPFSIKVLIERVKSLLRREQMRHSGEAEDVISRQGVTIDRLKHRALINGEPMDLTPSEFRLLETMVRQPGRAFGRTELVDSALGADAMVLERTIDVHIRSLRKKMGKHADLIETVRGIGYRFREMQIEA